MKATAHARPFAARAFTLIELLVVVAVMATLAALAFPAIGRARQAADGSKCFSNLHQLHLFFMQTVSDNDQTMPIAIYWTSSAGTHSFMGLARDAKQGDIRLCPAQKKYLPAGYSTNAATYAMNATIQDVLAPRMTPIKITSMLHPAQTMILCDGSVNRTATVADGFPGYVEIMNGVYPQAVHSGRAHVVFLDGHADALTSDQIPKSYAPANTSGSLFWTGL